MRRSLFSVLFGTVLCFGALTCAAQAQLVRTWVSAAVGDDLNPCTQHAPCRTFAAAYSQTTAGGEIDVLDAGGYGTLPIDKAITIDGGAFASVLATSGNAITVSAGPNDVVRLKNLRIIGALGAENGIQFLSGQSVHVEHCVIQNFTNNGLQHSTAGGTTTFLTVENSIFEGSWVGLSTSNSLIGAGPNPNRVTVKNTSFINNRSEGIDVRGNTSMQIKNVLVAGNGFSSNSNAITAGQGSELNVEDSIVTNNNIGGIFAIFGGIIRVSNTTVTDNNGTGVNTFGDGSQMLTYGNNRVQGNRLNGGAETNGTFTGTVPLS